MTAAYSIRVRGVVQGVGFRPFVYKLASANGLRGWISNANEGVEIHLEGEEESVESVVREISLRPPAAAAITEFLTEPTAARGFGTFTIRESNAKKQPTVRISPDLPVCPECLQELLDPDERRCGYPYINCTNCGPRYSLIRALPYDRCNTTMAGWKLDELCDREYHDPGNRRFHAQPVSCSDCGPHYYFETPRETIRGDQLAVDAAAEALRSGKILAVKGIGGYHLACDARNAESIASLRTRKFRKDKPFALMAKDLDTAKGVIELDTEATNLLKSVARPIVLSQAKADFAGISPDNDELGVMLPYAPLHHLLFNAGAPELLVLTSANRSSEPIAYRDDEARQQLAGIADAFLIGEREIARRIDDSVARVGPFGLSILRRSRGYAPGVVATFPGVRRPILALGADLKNSITLVVEGQAFVSQHIGDLDQYRCLQAFQKTVDDFLSMYQVDQRDVLVACDAHPGYVSANFAAQFMAGPTQTVQHHRAHIASVLAERSAWDARVLGVSFDGNGYGDDGNIWGGEIFIGSLHTSLERIAHLRVAALPGGDAAALSPVQAAAGFLAQLNDLPDLTGLPFSFPARYARALRLALTGIRSFATTSVGRLFDTAAALLGFTQEMSFEGQAAMWLEAKANRASNRDAYPFPFLMGELDFRPLLDALCRERLQGRDLQEIARAFQLGIAQGLCEALNELNRSHRVDAVVLSGGVFQNQLLLRDVRQRMEHSGVQIWTNHMVPPNDGGISLGQAAIAAVSTGSESAYA
jgi:hydrogenase maturation protein HypF